MPKVSVIVPVYGVEKYIERCARSLFEQTLEDMEFIFVDDCTPDRSIDILKVVMEDYSSRKEQVKILRMQQNSGLHKVRKEGLKVATGDYIAHCDSDDWVELDMYKSMYEYAVANDFDLLKCQYFTSDGINNKAVRLDKEDKTKEEIISELLSVKGWNCIWDKIAKRELYYNYEIIYPKTPMWEDFVISTQLIINSHNFGVLDKPLYYYYCNPNSICTTKSNNADLRRCENAIENMPIIISSIETACPNRPFDREILLLKYEAKRKLIPMMSNYNNYKYWNSILPEIDIPLLTKGRLSGILYLQYLMIVLRLYPIYKLICK